MLLQYTDVFVGGKVRKIKAEITTEHPASSYGMPVVVLPDGQALDAGSWTMLGYQIVTISKTEAPMMERWLGNLYAMLGMSALGRKGGSVKSEAKTASSRANGKRGGRPREILGRIYAYESGQMLVEFRRGGPHDWFVWAPKLGQRLATYTTQRELMDALARIEAAYPDDMPTLYQIRVELLSGEHD